MQEIVWLLLPVAAGSGWWLARHSDRSDTTPRDPVLSPDYFRGLNYLLNEEPDKAIDVFVQMIEVDTETVETHIALGNLFRRRGEIERAIRIHQNLIARPALTREQKGQALLELGQDYMRAGLFDRAEDLFRELRQMNLHVRRTLLNLKDIYQQERDWQACLDVTGSLQSLGGKPMNLERSHYHCELAEEALRAGNAKEGQQQLDKALATNPECARAHWIQADAAKGTQDFDSAIEGYRRVGELDPGLRPEMVAAVTGCYRELDDSEGLREYLAELGKLPPDPALDLAVVDALCDSEGVCAALEFHEQRLQASPTLQGLLRYAELHSETPTTHAPAVLSRLGEQVARLIDAVPPYQCIKCGFNAKTIHWQCPSCRSWSTIKRRPDIVDCNRLPA